MFKGIFLVLLSLSFTVAMDAKTMKTAEKCGTNIDGPPVKIFANVDAKGGWREFKAVADIPPLDLGGGAAVFGWFGMNGRALIEMQEPTEDWSSYTFCCFDRSNLWLVRYGLRTAWGWGFRKGGSVIKGRLQTESTEFFETTHDRVMPKPEMADDIPNALRPTLCLSKSQLPFSRLLTSASEASRKPIAQNKD
jgi:hypothetical protein